MDRIASIEAEVAALRRQNVELNEHDEELHAADARHAVRERHLERAIGELAEDFERQSSREVYQERRLEELEEEGAASTAWQYARELRDANVDRKIEEVDAAVERVRTFLARSAVMLERLADDQSIEDGETFRAVLRGFAAGLATLEDDDRDAELERLLSA